MVNYQNGQIYKLVNNVDDKIYIGSSCNKLNSRKSQHKSKAHNSKIRLYNHLNKGI